MQTTNEVLHKNIEVLKQKLEEKEGVIKKLREEISSLNYKRSNQSWVEND
tara:strand:- start:15 stop:164 length:150 start_codon:yes stop_codon:yes gene_type:complete